MGLPSKQQDMRAGLILASLFFLLWSDKGRFREASALLLEDEVRKVKCVVAGDGMMAVLRSPVEISHGEKFQMTNCYIWL